jgi:integrase
MKQVAQRGVLAVPEIDRALATYRNFLVDALNARSPALVQVDRWDADFLLAQLGTSLPAPRQNRVAARRFPPLIFAGPDVVRDEVKLYVVEALFDRRHASYKWWYDRRPLFRFIAQQWPELSTAFAAPCVANIPSPLRPTDPKGFVTSSIRNNPELVQTYADWFEGNMGRRIAQKRAWTVKDGLVVAEYPDGPVSMVGELHRWIVIKQEQMAPLDRRNIIVIGDVFSESEMRLTERQKRHDATINLYKLPGWLRDVARSFLLDKIQHGETSPATVPVLLSTIARFRDFMCERFSAPSASLVNRELIENDFLAWGRARNLQGRNWFNDPVAMLNAAARRFPETWPVLNIDPRATRRLLGQGRTSVTSQNLLQRPAEPRSRAMPTPVVEAIANHARQMPPPCPLLFLAAIVVGARAEDLHALSFDALQPDPDDERFLILHFWQNKVRRWNTKPLLRTDPLHREFIQSVEQQRQRLIDRYGGPTKFLFPVFNGQMEGFCTPGWSSEQLRRLCIEHEIRGEDGKIHRFNWHSLRHYRGTQMAHQGQDVLAIMLELGHVSPDMAMTYANRRLDLKKKALLDKGGGQFFTIQGEVDSHVAELLLRKDSVIATRVAGGACTLPRQLGDWCDHAHACLSCKHFRADASAGAHFEAEREAIARLVAAQAEESSGQDGGMPRSGEILRTRLDRNRTALESVNNILVAIRKKTEYVGTESRFRRPSQ